jgi:hypothetical protein
MLARNVVEGAAPALFAALAEEVREDAKWHGAYLSEFGNIAAPCRQAQDLSECERLWASSEKVLGL